MVQHRFKLLAGLTVLALTLAALPAAAQTAAGPAGASRPDGSRKDASRDGTARKDTVVLHPKSGDTLSVRLPAQGQVMITSLIPWAVTGAKEATPELVVTYDVRGIQIQHIGARGGTGAKASFTLRLVDGRTITVNVRTTPNAKFQISYAVIT
jgi:hypothetical protein